MLAITGANGHLGSRLLARHAEAEHAGAGVRALVRSRRAADSVAGLGLGEGVDVRVVDYHDVEVLAESLNGCSAVVHLVGIIKEGATSSYESAHEGTCTVLAKAAERAGVARIVYLSILGASPDSDNACLASKGAAEEILHEAPVPVTVIRVPMVLGEGDFAAGALAARARRGWNLVLRGGSLEQPIYGGDVVTAVLAVLAADGGDHRYDLAGPESLTRASLIHRAAGILGRRTRVLSLPLTPALALAGLLERVSSNPPVTRTMLGVLDHDDCIDTGPAERALGLTLTSLDEMLRRCLCAEEAGS